MAYFGDINKKIKDFFDDKTYNLQRTLKLDVRDDKTKWSVENKLGEEGKLESELKATNDFGGETFTLTASSKNNPKLEWKSKLFSDYFDFSTTCVGKESTLELEGKKSVSKFNIALKGKYKWDDKKCTSILDTTYVGIDHLVVGSSLKMDRIAPQNNYVYSYDFGAQYDHSSSQSFSLVTEESLSKVNAGTILKFDHITSYAQVSYQLKGQNASEIGWSVGVEKKLNDASKAAFVYRHDSKMSLLYNLDFPKNKVNAQVSCNYPYPKKPNLEWKLTFSP